MKVYVVQALGTGDDENAWELCCDAAGDQVAFTTQAEANAFIKEMSEDEDENECDPIEYRVETLKVK